MRVRRGDAAGLRHLIEFLRREGVIPGEKVGAPRPTRVERCAQAYERYLREERVLATATILNYVPFVRCFLKDRFGNGTVKLSRLCAGDVIRFVQRQARRLHPKRAKLLTTALRSFLQYATLSRRGDSGFGGCCSSRGQLVDDIAAPCD